MILQKHSSFPAAPPWKNKQDYKRPVANPRRKIPNIAIFIRTIHVNPLAFIFHDLFQSCLKNLPIYCCFINQLVLTFSINRELYVAEGMGFYVALF